MTIKLTWRRTRSAAALSHPAASFARPDWRWGRRRIDRLALVRMALIGAFSPALARSWQGGAKRNRISFRAAVIAASHDAAVIAAFWQSRPGPAATSVAACE